MRLRKPAADKDFSISVAGFLHSKLLAMRTFYREDESMMNEVPNAGKLAEGTDYQIIRLILKPGEAQVLHRNQRRVIFYVINGKGVLQVDGRNFQLGMGDGAEVMTYEQRAWKNIGEEDLELLVFKFL
ncbi:MAG: hypothetical protein PWP35_1978 [Bacteroidales bacterium]|nr:hypothetical protein [Bacteroidales bacterium]